MKLNLDKLYYAYSFARAGSFKAQGVFLPLVQFVAAGKKRPALKNQDEHFKTATKKVSDLLLQDAENIQNNYYPATVLIPENIFKHVLRLPSLFKDAFLATKRKTKKVSNFFDTKAETYLKGLPKYYTRNFHFQTSGYLGEESAELYEHQVEVLFSGTADPMRRQIIPMIKKHFKNSNGKGLKFLEIGSGTGRLTRFMSLAFPEAEITSIDLSEVYLNKAQDRLSEFSNIKYIQGAGENLKFKAASFDCVYSCFLFHELPKEIRQAVCNESFRVLKKKGFYGFVDSLQLKDDSDLDWALTEFPKEFHEPFFKNYITNPMESVMAASKFINIKTETAFLSKIVGASK